MAPEEDGTERVLRKFTKKKKREHGGPLFSADLPEGLRDGGDSDEDCTAAPASKRLLNQSMFGMIAAAGSQADLNARFGGPTSEDEDESESRPLSTRMADSLEKGSQESRAGPQPHKHRRKLSGNKLLRSVTRLGSKSKSKSMSKSNLSSPSTTSPPANDPIHDEGETESIHPHRDAPVMSQMLKARAELSMRPSFDMPRLREDQGENEEGGQASSSLARRLMEIFGFTKPEDVIEEYECWLVKNVMLKGFMYITSRHICFYAYLPWKSDLVKSGYLSKCGKRNPKYNRYWFRLKGDVLSYFTDPADLYFPRAQIDLRYGISADIVDKTKDATHFLVVTNEGKYNFKADSAPSAKEWVKALQKIIFRAHNSSDSVKISIPIPNVVDVEDSHMLEFATTCKIRVLDDNESYAIDEYLFSFFSFGREALNVLKIMVEGTASPRLLDDESSPPVTADGAASPKRNFFEEVKEIDSQSDPHHSTTSKLEESVRTTLSPILGPGAYSPKAQSPRASKDLGRKISDAFRRSVDHDRLERRNVDDGQASTSRAGAGLRRITDEERLSEKQGSSDSFSQSLEDHYSSGANPSDNDGSQLSNASQILRGSDVFFSPTIQRSSSMSQRDRAASSNKDRLSPSPTRNTVGRYSDQQAAAGGNRSTSNAGKDERPETTMQTVVKAGAYPLQRAAGIAGYLNKTTRLLANESMGYVGKVSGMLTGGSKHFGDPEASGRDGNHETSDESMGDGDRFRAYFALPVTEKLHASYHAFFQRVVPLYGKLYIGTRHLCYRSFFTDLKLVLPLEDVETVHKEKGYRFGLSGLVVVIKGYEEIFFEFNKSDLRDDCTITLLHKIEFTKAMNESGLLSTEEKLNMEHANEEHKALQEARQEGVLGHAMTLPPPVKQPRNGAASIFFDDPRASILNFKPTESLRITCLTIGSRGDVQPYIALCKGLLAEGHKPKIATHIEFKGWVESYGIEFAPVDGDPAELMRICVDYGMFTYGFLKEAKAKFRPWIDGLLLSSWTACQDTDLLIESPSAMAGIHIAEALEIPYFRAFSMPWTKTRAYPHPFFIPSHQMGGTYNYYTYVMMDHVFWKGTSFQINSWRRDTLKLRATNYERMETGKVPFLYSISPHVVVPPLDFNDWIRITGYWFLDEGDEYKPHKDLLAFIAKARHDKMKLVYIGFGSIVVPDSAELTRTVVKSVLAANDVRCILSKGWSDRLDKKGANDVEETLPPEIFKIKSVPHDWLFQQVDAAFHHGGSGTTGASLRAGIPTIIKPFFGDQHFFARRVQDLGVGILVKKMNVTEAGRAIWHATRDKRLIDKAKALGEQIRKENGVDTAIQSIYRDLEYAKSIIKYRSERTGEAGDDDIEDWTLIGDDSDQDLISRKWEARLQPGLLAGSGEASGSHIAGGV